MDIKDFRYFESVARNQKFVTAADELYISQPSLSKAISNLEKELGYKLFNRSTKKLVLTEFGSFFHRHAMSILNQYDNTVKELNDIKTVGINKLKIGIIESFGYSVPYALMQFQKVYPNVSIQIKEMSPRSIESTIESNDIHIGITSNDSKSEYIFSESIMEENLSLVTQIKNKYKNLNAEDILKSKDEVFIYSLPGFELRKIIRNYFQSIDFESEILYEMESLDTAYNMVKMGLGISIFPNTYIQLNQEDDINIVNLNNPFTRRNVYVAYKKDRYLPRAFHDFIQIIKELSKNKIF